MNEHAERSSHIAFSEEKADRAVRFIRAYCRHTKGIFAGLPFDLKPWQEYHVREIFGRVDDEGNRIIRQAYIEIPKKNGKSELAAAIALLLLFADDEIGAEIYGAAADRDQASIVFNVAAAMVRQNRDLMRACRIIDSIKRIAIPGMDSYYRAMSRIVYSKHGFNPHGVIFDEVHAQADMRLWNVMTVGASDTRMQPLVFAITTAGVKGESPVAEVLHEQADQILRGIVPCPDWFYPVIYAAPENVAWDDEEAWRSCNPALGDFLRLAAVRAACDAAKQRGIGAQNEFRQLRLNQWVQQTRRWIDMADWDACGGRLDMRELRHLPCYLGLDLSTKLDVTALVKVFVQNDLAEPIYHLVPHFWIPEDSVERRGPNEQAMFRQWIGRRLVETTPGNVLDFGSIRQRIKDLTAGLTNVRQIRFDPMFATQLAQQLTEDGYKMVDISQTYRNFSEPCKEFEAALVSRRLLHGGHPVLRWMADCVELEQRSDGAVRPRKPDRMQSGKRIDGIVAAIMGLSGAMLIDRPSVYSTRGIQYV